MLEERFVVFCNNCGMSEILNQFVSGKCPDCGSISLYATQMYDEVVEKENGEKI